MDVPVELRRMIATTYFVIRLGVGVFVLDWASSKFMASGGTFLSGLHELDVAAVSDFTDAWFTFP